MGQKGKFVSQRAGYSVFWHDLWYSSNRYHSIHFQNNLVRDFIFFLMFIGITTTGMFNTPLKKTTNLLKYTYKYKNNYIMKMKSIAGSFFFDRGYIRPLRGVYLTKFHVIKLFNDVIVYGSGYKWRKTRGYKLFRVERRLNLFYSSLLLLDNKDEFNN